MRVYGTRIVYGVLGDRGEEARENERERMRGSEREEEQDLFYLSVIV